MAKSFRAHSAARDTPTVVLPGKEGTAIKAKAFALAAYDYPVQLPGPIERAARARRHWRAYLSRPGRDEAHRRLAEGRRRPAVATTEIAAAVRETSATGKELSGAMNEVNGRVHQAADLAGAGRERLGSMGRTMRQPVESTGSISSKLAVIREKADSITQVVTTITNVADQTNPLSINAAGEAEKAERSWAATCRDGKRRPDWAAPGKVAPGSAWDVRGRPGPPIRSLRGRRPASPGPAARGRPGVALPGGAAGPRRLVKRATFCAQLRRGA